MKTPEKIITVLMVIFLSLAGAYSASAQEIVVPEGYELVDSLVYRHVSGVDTLLENIVILPELLNLLFSFDKI